MGTSWLSWVLTEFSINFFNFLPAVFNELLEILMSFWKNFDYFFHNFEETAEVILHSFFTILRLPPGSSILSGRLK